MLLIGVDEAGYGPNLGPLVITATLWKVDDKCVEDLYRVLAKVVRRSVPTAESNRRLALADSKVLYKSGQGLALLELGVLAALAQTGGPFRTWHDVWSLLDTESALCFASAPWHAGFHRELPLEAAAAEIQLAANRLRRGLEQECVQLLAVRSACVFPERFNACTQSFGNKGEALSRLTLRLLSELLPDDPQEHVRVVCDKHGGRNRYSALLQTQWPDRLVEVHGESLAESVYRWGVEHARVEVRFRAGGEAFLPAALASMVSKYLRELAMAAFNDFWCCRLPGLRPTAGYPGDARRFKNDIAELQTRLGIEDRILWRDR